jgi:hypothetical protein
MWLLARANRGWRWSGILAATAALTVVACQDGKAPTGEHEFSRGRMAARGARTQEAEATIEVFAPENGDHVGQNGVGWFIDLAVEFETGDVASTGFTGSQLTGPGVHNNAAPLPGNDGLGADDKFSGLIVLVSTNSAGAGGCQNLADLFNITGPTNITEDEVEIWDTWIIEGPYTGAHTPSIMWVAEADDLNGDGIFNDAPDVVTDSNGDGKCNEADLKAVGLASGVAEKRFFIN